MIDLTHISIPQWFTSAIGLAFLALSWRVGGVWLDAKVKRFSEKRRVGTRSTDDVHETLYRETQVDRILEAWRAISEVNIKVAENLAIMNQKQDALLESFRLSQIEHQQIMRQIENGRKAGV